MNRALVSLGAFFLALGFVMPQLLGELMTVTFRAAIPPWLAVSLPLAVLGGALALAGLRSGGWGTLDRRTPARYFGYATVVNSVAAVAFILPVLLPRLEFPILITRWPGIYMVTAYLSFLVVGVLGCLGWAVMYGMSPSLFSRETFDRGSVLLHLALTEVGIYGLSTFMFWGGYIGSVFAYNGVGDTMVGIVMESTVIPSAIFIYASIFALLLGVVTVVFPPGSARRLATLGPVARQER